MRPGSGRQAAHDVLERVERRRRVAQRVVEDRARLATGLLLGGRLLGRWSPRGSRRRARRDRRARSLRVRRRCRAPSIILRAASRRAATSPRRISSAWAGVICEPAAGSIGGCWKLSWSIVCLRLAAFVLSGWLPAGALVVTIATESSGPRKSSTSRRSAPFTNSMLPGAMCRSSITITRWRPGVPPSALAASGTAAEGAGAGAAAAGAVPEAVVAAGLGRRPSTKTNVVELCSFLSSRITKSLFVSPVTGLPLASVTITSSWTASTRVPGTGCCAWEVLAAASSTASASNLNATSGLRRCLRMPPTLTPERRPADAVGTPG